MKTAFHAKAMASDTVTTAQMKEIERNADEAGLSYYQMMENAGTAAAEEIARCENAGGKRVLIVCGKGNNGGDGFVVARKLTEAGAHVTLMLPEGELKTKDATENYRICSEMGIASYSMPLEYEQIRAEVESAHIIVDAVFGTGFHGALSEQVRGITVAINAASAKVYALDIPSGVTGDTGAIDENAVRADRTIAFHRLKPAHLMHSAAAFCGEVLCVSIGIENVLEEA